MKTEELLNQLRNHPDVDTNEDVKQQLQERLRRKAERLEKNKTYVYVGKITTGVLLFTFVLLIFVSPVGKELIKEAVNGMFHVNQSVTDEDTTSETPVIHGDKDYYITVYYGYDDMDRGNHDYFNKDVVVDAKHYEANKLKRGDIIAYKENPNVEESLIRVIGLPGEKVKIEKGQIYIDDKILDTFYGRAHRAGKDLYELKEELKRGDLEDSRIKQNVKSMIDYFETFHEKEIIVPEGQVYVIGDDWFRTHMIGLLPTDKVVGKVIGYR